MHKLVLAVTSLILIFSAQLTFAEELPVGLLKDPVVIQSGNIQGKANDNYQGVSEFLGIPYAQPPVGELRWKLPQPPKKWQIGRAHV